jgi:hypothetical protein
MAKIIKYETPKSNFNLWNGNFMNVWRPLFPIAISHLAQQKKVNKVLKPEDFTLKIREAIRIEAKDNKPKRAVKAGSFAAEFGGLPPPKAEEKAAKSGDETKRKRSASVDSQPNPPSKKPKKPLPPCESCKGKHFLQSCRLVFNPYNLPVRKNFKNNFNAKFEADPAFAEKVKNLRKKLGIPE